MAQISRESSTYVPHLKELAPGLRFEYKVPAEKGLYGDFAEPAREEWFELGFDNLSLEMRLERSKSSRYQFDLFGHWIISAAITEEVENGHSADFKVFVDDDNEDQTLMNVSGIIIPAPKRPEGRTLSMVDELKWFIHYGTYSVEEGFSTTIEDFTIDGEKREDGKRMLIPGRRIVPGTLRIMGMASPEENG